MPSHLLRWSETRTGWSPHSFNFTKVLNQHPDARRHLFWREVAALRSSPETAQISHWREIPYPRLEGLEFGEADVGWLLEDATIRGPVLDRLLAVDAAIRLSGAVASAEAETRIRAAIADHPQLITRLDRILERARHDPPDPHQRRFQREQAARDAKHASLRDQNQAHLLAHLEELRSGRFHLLWWIYQNARDDNRPSRWGKSSLDSIRREYGPDVHDAAVQGFKQVWRDFRPLLPHEREEREERNRVENGLIIGLTGLALQFNAGFNLADLTPAQAELAARYACGEMNGFPGWFDGLVGAHPESVRPVLEECLRADYQAARDQPVHHDVLEKVRLSSTRVKQLCAPLLVTLIQTRPAHAELLEQALSVLLDAGGAFTQVLAGRARAAVETSATAGAVETWWPVWFRLEPNEAADALVAWAQRYRRSSKSREACMAALVSASHHLDGVTGTALAGLARLAYQVIKPVDDLERIGAYSPTLRDDAERARGYLVTALENTPGSSKLILDLAASTWAAPHSPWLKLAARRRLGRDAEPEPLTEEQVLQWEQNFTSPPESPAQLFCVVLARLRNIARDAAEGDFSTRGLFQHQPHESEFQKWLAHELRIRSRNHYSVEREPEVDRRKRPDIRLSMGAIGPVTIELKCADRWSGRQLEEAVTDQLIGRYMRDSRARHGVLVISRVKQGHWRPPGQGLLALEQLVTHLQGIANRAVADHPPADVRVLAIDFRPPAIGSPP